MDRSHKLFLAGLLLGVMAAAAVAVIGNWWAGSYAGSGSMAGEATINGTVRLMGDIADDISVPVRDIVAPGMADVPSLRNRSGATTSVGVPVTAFLKACGVNEYDRLVFYADDYALTINRSDVTSEMILVPDGVSLRLFCGNLPICSWVKNVRFVVVIGAAGSSLLLDGRPVSFGSMLDDGIETLVYHRGTSGYVADGIERDVETAGVTAGIALKDLLFKEGYVDFAAVTVTCGGVSERYNRTEVLSGSLFLTRYQGRIKLAADDELVAGWKNVDSLEVE
jgi:hypothetical protein